MTDNGRASPRSASPRAEPSEEQPRDTLTADEAKAQARAIAGRYGHAPTTHWKLGTAPQGEPNPLYDPAVAARAAREAVAVVAAREDAVLGEKPEDPE